MVRVLDSLAELLAEVSEREILPRWKRLASSDIISKATAADPDDLVTVADRAAEKYLSERLPKLVPGSVVVGEEAVAQTPSVLHALDEDAPVWLVDPIDGTKNFAAGTGAFGVMVALVERGETTLSGIYLPVERDLYLAEHGAGSTWNGVRLVSQAPREPKLLGTVYTRLMPKDVRASLNERPENIVLGDSPQCAALEYGRIARGERDFALYYRLHPWDHAPGVLIVQEAGGVARRVTSSRENYAPRDSEPLLLVASDEARWEAVRRALLDGPAS